MPPPKRKLSGRGRWSWAAIALLVARRRRRAARDLKLISGGGIGGGGANKGKGGPVAISSATDYDPQGDGEEVGSKVGLAVDGNPTGTAWETRALRLRNIRRDQDRPRPRRRDLRDDHLAGDADRMIVRTPTPGWDAEVFAAASGPPEDTLRRWGEPVGEVVGASSTEEIELDVPKPSRYFLLWFNKASEARDQAGRYQVEISDISLLD